MKTILSLHSQVAGARVGNGIVAFVMERIGVRVLQIPTVLYGRRPDRGAPGGEPVSAAVMRSIFKGLAEDGPLRNISAILTGYMASVEQIEAALECVDAVKSANASALFVCDPIMGDDGKLYVREEIADAIVEGLVRQADWIAPNLWEMSRIAGRPCTDLDDVRSAARRFGKPALISSVPLENGIGVLYAAPSGDWLCQTPRLPRAPKGTGDLLTALFLARRLNDQGAAVALEAATGAVHDVIVRSLALGSDDLALPEAQDLLVDPKTWPRAISLGV